MKKMGKLTGAIISTITSVNVTACDGKETLTEEEANKISLNDIIGTKLNDIAILDEDKKPTKAELLVGIKDNNPNSGELTVNDFEFKGQTLITNESATIIGVGKYNGEVSLEYSRATNLNKYIRQPNLETINIPASLSNNNEIKSELIKLILKHNAINPSLNMKKISISNININNGKRTAVITTTDNNIYIGTIEVNFTVNVVKKINLDELYIHEEYNSLPVNTTIKFNQLNITEWFDIFKTINLTNPTIEYFDFNTKENITDHLQKNIEFQIKITASDDDPYYTGLTSIAIEFY